MSAWRLSGNPNKRLSFVAYYLTTVGLGILGLVASAYLAYSHYRNYTDIGYQSICAISQAINCDTVSQSSYAVMLGLPVALWGMIGYLVFLLLLIPAWATADRGRRVWQLLFWLAFSFSIISIILGVISTYLVRSYCIFCVVTYGVNFLLVWFSWLVPRRFNRDRLLAEAAEDLRFVRRHKKVFSTAAAAMAGLIALLIVFMPAYWIYEPPPISTVLASGTTAEGHPWIGASNPQLVVEMFSDYQCFQCRKVHRYIRHLIIDHPDSIRLIHRHFPMDRAVNPLVKEEFHVGSGKMALLAIYAASSGKFWQMNDLLYGIDPGRKEIDLRWIAEQVGVNADELAMALSNPAMHYKLRADIRRGIELGILGTPSFVIEGKVHSGMLPASILADYVNPG